MSVRVYLPATLPILAAAIAARGVSDHGTRFVAEDESEESEYDAMLQAAAASGELLREPNADAGRRRVVVVVEADNVGGDALYPWRDVVAVHVDTEDDADPDDDLAWHTPQEMEVWAAGGF